LAAAQGIGKGDADEKCEGGLDGVVQAHADPGDVGLIEAQELPDWVCGKRFGDLGQAEDFSGHEKHD
jgi:hypothetical protein